MEFIHHNQHWCFDTPPPSKWWPWLDFGGNAGYPRAGLDRGYWSSNWWRKPQFCACKRHINHDSRCNKCQCQSSCRAPKSARWKDFFFLLMRCWTLMYHCCVRLMWSKWSLRIQWNRQMLNSMGEAPERGEKSHPQCYRIDTSRWRCDRNQPNLVCLAQIHRVRFERFSETCVLRTALGHSICVCGWKPWWRCEIRWHLWVARLEVKKLWYIGPHDYVEFWEIDLMYEWTMVMC